MEAEEYSFKFQMAEIAKEINAKVVIEFHNITETFTQETFDEMIENGMKTDIFSCVVYALSKSGKTEKDIEAFLKEAEEAHHGVRILFETVDGSKLDITSPEDKPKLAELVRAAQAFKA